MSVNGDLREMAVLACSTSSRQARHVLAGRGSARQGAAGRAWRGRAWYGEAGRGRRGRARYGRAWLGEAGEACGARPGMAWHGVVRRGEVTNNKEANVTYQWARGSVHTVDAETAGGALEAISKRYGFVLPETVVAESRPENAPLHDEFEWDDSTAANAYREDQARGIIRHITIRIEKDDTPHDVRAFVHVLARGQTAEDDREPVYIRTLDALKDADYRAQVLERAMREIDGWRRRYADYSELALIFQQIDTVRRELIAV